MNKRSIISLGQSRCGFTFVEVLAAMLFMAIVIPVVVEGLSVASRLGTVADRKKAAAELADRILTEKVANGEWRQGGQQGDLQQDTMNYHWILSTENWSEDSMLMANVEVRFKVQEREYEVTLSTLVNEDEQ